MRKITNLLFILLISSKLSNAQTYKWAKGIGGGISFDLAYSIAVDDSGNVYTTGTFWGTVDFDPGPGTSNLSSVGSGDIFITKLDSAGNYIWAKNIGGSSWDYGYSIAVDSAQNVYTTGIFGTTVDFDPGPGTSNLTSAGGNDIFISKLDAAGNFVWAKSISGTSNNLSNSIAIDDFGNVYTTGNFRGIADFDPGLGTSNLTSLGGRDIFLSKLDATGNFIWAKKMGGASDDSGYSVAVDSASNIYITGSFEATVDFDPGPGTSNLTSFGSRDIFISKLDAIGNFVWAKSMGGSSYDEGYSIALDDLGNIYTTGQFQLVVDFDPGPGIDTLTSAGVEDIFISKLNPAGDLVWAKSMGGASKDVANFISVDGSSNAYITGRFQGTADFVPGPGIYNLTSLGSDDIFISKLDSSGNFMWATSIGGSSLDLGQSIALDDSANVYTTGIFEATVDFNPGPGIDTLTSLGGYDTFILKLHQDACSNFSLIIDSTSNVTCLDSGHVFTHTNQGLYPISYSWNTTPATNDSLISLSSPGIYTLSATDANNCNISTTILINGPSSIGNFDLNANLIATSFRPAFQSLISLDAFNDGCDTTSGQLKLVLDQLTSYTNSSINPDIIIGDTLIWNFNTLIYDSVHFSPSINILVDTNAVIGDTVCFEVMITPLSGDADTANNIKQYCFPIVNGYDPNDKQVYPQGKCPINYTKKDEPLTYTIRFQNTGNSNAININIIDSIDYNLDISTTRIIGYSHPMYTETLQGNVLKFNFDSILLPDSSSNPIASQGYVIFEIHPHIGTPNYTVVENKSEIYFDFNPAIQTNTVMNTLIDVIPTCTTVKIDKFYKETKVNIYPNPVFTTLYIESNYQEIKMIEIVDVTGKILYSKRDKVNSIKVNNLKAGIYFIRVYNEKNIFTRKFIKE